MTVGPYTPCPCGSGKQFKWCCSSFYSEIEHALDQEAKGQHETALRLIDKVIEGHPNNPDAWGQKARLLWIHQKPEEADETLNKAFELNPSYPFGLLLRSRFRWEEGELGGALLLARQAADAYQPEAKDYLFEVYSIIFQAEMRMHRPVAARAALRLALRCSPGNQEVQGVFDNLFGPEGQLPNSARLEYTLLGAPSTLTPEQRATWDKALASTNPVRLGELARLFEGLTQQDPGNPAAWYNLGLARAWLGENPAAIEALNHFLELKPADEDAGRAGALMEVLRTGVDLFDQSDYQEWSFLFQIKQDPEPLVNLINEWQQKHQLIVTKTDNEQVFLGLILDFGVSSVLTSSQSVAPPLVPVAGYIMISQNLVRIWGFNKSSIERLRETIRQRIQLTVADAQIRSEPLAFHEVCSEAMVFPSSPTGEVPQQEILEHICRFYEEKWIHLPRRSLGGLTPLEAARQPVGRLRLLGLIQYLEDCGQRAAVGMYNWNHLRQKLGLAEGGPVEPSAGGSLALATPEQVAAISPETLQRNQLEQAFQAAVKLQVPQQAVRFASAIVALPAEANPDDRWPWYSYLAQHQGRENNWEVALKLIEDGEAFDKTHNQGRHAVEYGLRRAQILSRQGKAEPAHELYQQLLEQIPRELKHRITAVEAMLSLKKPAWALAFAEEGLKKARQQNDRDSEQAFAELAGAARKQLG